MTHKEALTLALNALKRITDRFDLESVTEDATKAITAAEEALAQPEQFKPLTDEQFKKIKASLSRQEGWDGDGWDLALKEAIEAAHGIKE